MSITKKNKKQQSSKSGPPYVTVSGFFLFLFDALKIKIKSPFVSALLIDRFLLSAQA